MAVELLIRSRDGGRDGYLHPDPAARRSGQLMRGMVSDVLPAGAPRNRKEVPENGFVRLKVPGTVEEWQHLTAHDPDPYAPKVIFRARRYRIDMDRLTASQLKKLEKGRLVGVTRRTLTGLLERATD